MNLNLKTAQNMQRGLAAKLHDEWAKDVEPQK